jgi:TolB-like protein
LPFDDMSAKKDTEWFCDEVTKAFYRIYLKLKD